MYCVVSQPGKDSYPLQQEILFDIDQLHFVFSEKLHVRHMICALFFCKKTPPILQKAPLDLSPLSAINSISITNLESTGNCCLIDHLSTTVFVMCILNKGNLKLIIQEYQNGKQ